MARFGALVCALALAGFFAASVDAARSAKALNSICNDEISCDGIPNAECSANGVCVCKEDHGPMNSTYCGHLIGHTCYDAPCATINSTCHPVEKRCQCRTVSITVWNASSNKTYCYSTPKNFGDLCNEPQECSRILGPRGVCLEGYCVCEERYAAFNNTCREKKDELGLTCDPALHACYLEKDGIHNQHVECINGTCQCQEGYKPSKDKRSCSAGAYHYVSVACLLLFFVTKIIS